MILLSADLSDPLLELLRSQPTLVDALEVGPWFSLAQIQDYRRALPRLPFYFHGGDLLARVGLLPETIPPIAAYIAASGSPWVSMHLGLWPPGSLWLMYHRHIRPPLPDPQAAARRLAWQAKRLAHSTAVPLLLENVEPKPFPGCEFEVQARLITQLLETIDCGFLLDTGHARVAASALSMDVREYVSCLPLDRVQQVHVSGPRPRDGRLFDAHEPLQPEDYALLEYLLDRTLPTLVTLEYIRQPQALYEQLIRLRNILASRSSGCATGSH